MRYTLRLISSGEGDAGLSDVRLASLAADGQHAVFRGDINLVARQAGELHAYKEGPLSLVQVDRRRPRFRRMRPEVVALLKLGEHGPYMIGEIVKIAAGRLGNVGHRGLLPAVVERRHAFRLYQRIGESTRGRQEHPGPPLLVFLVRLAYAWGAMTSKPKTTIETLKAIKREGRKISMLTCYDYSVARLIDEAGVDAILVGDTYGEVCLGHDTTLPVTVEHLVVVTEAVRRGAPSAYLVGDMPFLSYQVTPSEAIRNAGLFMARAGCDCVKVEVDRRLVGTVEAMSAASIPVMAHLGLKPQSIRSLGGYRAQGRLASEALRIVEDARMMEEAGAVALLLEAVPMQVARIIAEATPLPVISCVSGPYCDGQVVVLHDMLGYAAGHPPQSVKRYANLHDTLIEAFRAYAQDVAGQVFPTEVQSISMAQGELDSLQDALRSRST